MFEDHIILNLGDMFESHRKDFREFREFEEFRQLSALNILRIDLPL